MKKKISLIIFFILAFIVTFIWYFCRYPVKNSTESIENYLTNKNYVSYKNASIQKQINIKNLKIVILKNDGTFLRYALFQKGLNGKYRFLYITEKNNILYTSFIQYVGNDYYLISLGYNNEDKTYINNILSSLSFENKSFTESFNIKNEKYFIKYKIVPNQSKNNYEVLSYNLKD